MTPAPEQKEIADTEWKKPILIDGHVSAPEHTHTPHSHTNFENCPTKLDHYEYPIYADAEWLSIQILQIEYRKSSMIRRREGETHHFHMHISLIYSGGDDVYACACSRYRARMQTASSGSWLTRARNRDHDIKWNMLSNRMHQFKWSIVTLA